MLNKMTDSDGKRNDRFDRLPYIGGGHSARLLESGKFASMNVKVN